MRLPFAALALLHTASAALSRPVPSAVPRGATLELLDACARGAFSSEPDVTRARSVREALAARTAVLSAGACYPLAAGLDRAGRGAPVSSVAFTVKAVGTDGGPRGSGPFHELLAVLEEYEGGGCENARLLRRWTLPPAAPGACARMPQSKGLAREAFFLLRHAPWAGAERERDSSSGSSGGGSGSGSRSAPRARPSPSPAARRASAAAPSSSSSSGGGTQQQQKSSGARAARAEPVAATKFSDTLKGWAVLALVLLAVLPGSRLRPLRQGLLRLCCCRDTDAHGD